MAPSLNNGTDWCWAGEILAVALARPLRRTDSDLLGAAAPIIQAGTPGLRAGSISYLVDDYAAAASIDTMYQGASAVYINNALGALDGFKHHAVGTLRITAERALPGRPSKWIVQVDVREVS